MDNRPIEPGRSQHTSSPLPKNDVPPEGSHGIRSVKAVDQPNEIPQAGGIKKRPPKPRRASHVRALTRVLREPAHEDWARGIQWLKSIRSRSETDLIRLFVDGRLLRKESGAEGYEGREPGCINRMSNAMGTLITLSEQGGLPNTVGAVKVLHQLVMGDSYLQNSAIKVRRQGGQLDTVGVSYPVVEENLIHSGKGLEETEKHRAEFEGFVGERFDEPLFFVRHRNAETGETTDLPIDGEAMRYLLDENALREAIAQPGDKTYKESVKNLLLQRASELIPGYFDDSEVARMVLEAIEKGGHQCIQFNSVPAEHIEALLDMTLTEFDTMLADAQSNDDVYKAIAWMLPRYMQIHPFPDANLRTAMLLANNSLMRFGLPPLVMDDPNIVQLMDEDAVVRALKEGSQNTLYLARKGDLHGFTFSDRAANSAMEKGYMEPLTAALDNFAQ